MNNNEENRNRMCNEHSMNDECQYTPQGINAAFGFNTEQIFNNNMNCCNNCNQEECIENRNRVRTEMLKQIKCLNFAVVDIAQYLDTHPEDRKALCLHREYCNQLEELKNKYQKVFGPLSIYYPCNKWRWLEEPWPWERSDFNVDL